MPGRPLESRQPAPVCRVTGAASEQEPQPGPHAGRGLGGAVGGSASHVPPLTYVSPPQPDLLYRERPRPAGAGPGLQPQQAVLPGQLRG